MTPKNSFFNKRQILDALFEAIARYTLPERPAWARSNRYRDLDVDEIEGIRGIMEKPELFVPEKVLLPVARLIVPR